MNRLWATILCDARIQWRNGFYLATIVIVALFVVALRQLPPASARWLLPVVVVNNLIVNAFYFIAGLVLLEKGEGTLQAQVVTPLRPAEYLAAKLATLAFLSLVENVAVVGLILGPTWNLLLLAAAVSLAAAGLALAGYLSVVRYHSMNEYLLPSILYVTLLGLPLLAYTGQWPAGPAGLLVYLHPLQAVIVLLEAALGDVASWKILYGLLYGGLWVGVAYRQALRAFQRFVVAT